jgi:hypothetical protein
VPVDQHPKSIVGNIITRLVGEEHNDLLACGAAKTALRAFVCDVPAHDLIANWVEVRSEIP